MDKNYENILIMSLADNIVFPFIRWQAETVKRHGGNCKYIIWDIGLEKQQVKELSEFAEVKDFKEINDIFQKHIAPISNEKLRKGGARSVITKASLKKPFCLRQCVLEGYENILYLDADAFLNKNPFEVFKASFNICVTFKGPRQSPPDLINRPEKLRFKLLNAGVQLFKGKKHKLLTYFNEFIDNYILERPEISDQGNLNRLIDRCEDWDWTKPRGYHKLLINEVKLNVFIIDCERYNRFVNNGGVPPFTIVGHAKGQKKRTFEINTWQDVEKWLTERNSVKRKEKKKSPEKVVTLLV